MKRVYNWIDRFALIDHYHPTDDQICTKFLITISELNDARRLRHEHGLFVGTVRVILDDYVRFFDVEPNPLLMDPTRPTLFERRDKVVKKVGRPGNRIINAYHNIPCEPTPAADFIENNNISLAVLKQHKRFTSTLSETEKQQLGQIFVKQDNTSKILMVWRVPIVDITQNISDNL